MNCVLSFLLTSQSFIGSGTDEFFHEYNFLLMEIVSILSFKKLFPSCCIFEMISMVSYVVHCAPEQKEIYYPLWCLFCLEAFKHSGCEVISSTQQSMKLSWPIQKFEGRWGMNGVKLNAILYLYFN